jgi:D-alanine-D-alanine ligase
MSMQILVLHDEIPEGAPPDQADAAVQAEAVREILVRAGYSVQVDTFRCDPVPILAARPDVIFNLVESVGGEGRLIHLAPVLFETMRVPFTGNGSAPMALTSDKRLTKRLLAARGVAVPEDWPRGGPRWIVKSLWEHASIGLDDSCIVGAADVPATMERMKPHMGGAVVAETYIEGRELNVSLLEEGSELHVLPAAGIVFGLPPGRERIVGYRAKWEEGSVEYDGTWRTFEVPGIDLVALETLCRQVFRELGLRGYARVDLRVSEDGVPHVLEVNTNPCLSPGAGFAAAVEQSGRTLQDAVILLLSRALTP